MEMIKKGAEADLYLADFHSVLHRGGKGKVIIKLRISKKYRIPEIDRWLRKSRTSLEAKLMMDAKAAGVPVPVIFEVDPESSKIVMKFIEGIQLKKILDRIPTKRRRKVYRKIGEYVAKLHRAGIVHGDLTTSNMILTENDEVFFIDFGLGEYDSSTEARGVDLHLLRRALESVHFRIVNEAYHQIIESYRKTFGSGAEEIIKRAEEISKRGRYVAREERTWR
ncbi:MAG: KEOPS complex kinase/ATPase Bud32 [Candidatus Hadarchaeales archaeon]